MQFQYTQPTKSGSASRMASMVADFTARFGPDEYRAPLAAVGEALMMTAWTLMLVLALVALVKFPFGRWLERGRVFHVVVMLAVPLPYVAMLSGWVFREVGRQPWMVFGVLKTRDALSEVGAGRITASFVAFAVLFGVLFVVNAWLLVRFARRGPEGARLGVLPRWRRRRR